MRRRRDALDRLREANPVSLEKAPASDSPHARALFERIVDPRPDVDRTKWWAGRRRLWVLIPVAALIGAASYGFFREPSEPLVVACYQQPSLDARRAVLPATNDAVGACHALWEPGAEFNPAGTTAVPPLTVCVLDTGARAVLPQPPGSDTCGELGLARPRDGGHRQSENQAIVNLQNLVTVRFLDACVDRTEAIAFIRTELKSQGLASWRVLTPIPFTKREPCASVSFDVLGRTVRLIPVANSSSP
jgi:hypothetical protein